MSDMITETLLKHLTLLALAAIPLSLAIGSSIHILLTKRDSRAGIAWIGLVWLAPILGPLTYLLFGINRVHSRAQEWKRKFSTDYRQNYPFDTRNLQHYVPASMQTLSRLSNSVSKQPLLGGNHITPLFNGDQAYPRMLQAIENAQQSVTLSSFILRNDRLGKQFADALAQAQQRGVAVRLLVDYMGFRYSFPTLKSYLKRVQLPYAEFMPPNWPRTLPFLNLRNHRKLLVIDGQLGFTGGMNISDHHCRNPQQCIPIEDIHFELEGPVVTELQTIFAEDWYASTGEMLRDTPWFYPPKTPGTTLARAIADGPDDRFNTLRQVMLGAISSAQQQIRIMTPYFVPDSSLEEALITAALRGIQVQILLPGRNNLRLVDWACRHHLAELIRHGVDVRLVKDRFTHSKLFMLDDCWTLFGSANWDNRSLALNFECNVECYDDWLTQALNQHFDQEFIQGEVITLESLSRQSVLIKLRNAAAGLLSPYL
ncbi:MAG: cardiolipin synthase [Nitrincola lacisaponensis]|uniref:cardiolipin synthase n=1 Tax=Nitrincola lacisaponensis TaxID=267850 RepID=UPI00391D8677